MEILKEKKWFAIYTKPRWEKKVNSRLLEKGVESWCPVQKKVSQWSDRKKIIEDPLFKSYVFVHIAEDERLAVLTTNGALQFVQYLKKPAVIRDEEIEAVKQFLKDYEHVQVEPVDVNINDEVTIVTGPLMQQKGQVMEVKHRMVKVMLPSLGFALVAIDKNNLAKDSSQ